MSSQERGYLVMAGVGIVSLTAGAWFQWGFLVPSWVLASACS